MMKAGFTPFAFHLSRVKGSARNPQRQRRKEVSPIGSEHGFVPIEGCTSCTIDSYSALTYPSVRVARCRTIIDRASFFNQHTRSTFSW